LAYLKKNGFVVVAEVVNDEEVRKAKNMFWDWL